MPTTQLFISYAHTDNQKIHGASFGWVDRFFEGLEMELQELALDFKFWRDKRDLEKDGFFDEKILAAIDESQVLVTILSPVYSKRPYCIKELNRFIGETSEQQSNNLERVIKVVKQPIDDESTVKHLPEFFSRMIGFNFFKIDRQDERVKRFITRDGKIVKKEEFWDAISDLACAISKHIANAPTEAGVQAAKTTVYLAETSSDLDAVYRTVRADLVAGGVSVLPDQHIPRSEEKAIERIDGDLAQADFAIHLLGDNSGFIPEGKSVYTGSIPVLASNKINDLRFCFFIGYHLRYQFHVLCLFCS